MVAISKSRGKDFKNYTSWLEYRKIDYVVLTHDTIKIPDNVKMLILTGGQDIGENLERDYDEKSWLNQAFNMQIPVLGICRGMQLINVALGGTLISELADVSETEHTSRFVNESVEKVSSTHLVRILDEKQFSYPIEFEVNSRHHQAIDVLGNFLHTSIESLNDLIPEAVTSDNGDIMGVQWHPERKEVRGTTAELFVLDWINSKLN